MRIAALVLACFVMAAPAYGATSSFDFSASLPQNIRGALSATAVTVSNPSANTSLAITAQSTYNANAVLSATAKAPNLQLQHNDASMRALTQVGNIYFFNRRFAHPEMGDLEYGACCVTKGDMGSFWTLQTKLDDGSGTMVEDLNAGPTGHLSEPYDNIKMSAASPASCAALARCSTVSYSFAAHPFITITGAPETPSCSNPGIQDTTSPGTIWIGNVNAVSSTSVTFNYAPTTPTTGVHALTVVFTCHESAF